MKYALRDVYAYYGGIRQQVAVKGQPVLDHYAPYLGPNDVTDDQAKAFASDLPPADLPETAPPADSPQPAPDGVVGSGDRVGTEVNPPEKVEELPATPNSVVKESATPPVLETEFAGGHVYLDSGVEGEELERLEDISQADYAALIAAFSEGDEEQRLAELGGTSYLGVRDSDGDFVLTADPSAEVSTDALPEPVDYSKTTVSKLKDLIDQRKLVPPTGRATKAKLIEVLEKADAADASE